MLLSAPFLIAIPVQPTKGSKVRAAKDAFIFPRSSRKVHHFRYALVRKKDQRSSLCQPKSAWSRPSIFVKCDECDQPLFKPDWKSSYRSASTAAIYFRLDARARPGHALRRRKYRSWTRKSSRETPWSSLTASPTRAHRCPGVDRPARSDHHGPRHGPRSHGGFAGAMDMLS